MQLRKRFVALSATIALVASLFSAFIPQQAQAADASSFNPGYIISDSVFFNSADMSVEGIQAFLNSKVPSCRAGYICLKDYSQRTTNIASDRYCNGYAGSASDSAANIIYKTAISCGINPKVLIVLLQKEQGLVLKVAPGNYDYNYATGNGCPDTSACDESLAGFFYQVYYGARSFKYYIANNSSYGYHWGQYNNIQYNPNADCGTQSVYIINKATAALYIYTPYVPSAAALADLYGTGTDPGCSAYGNRNFWRYFTDWFGSTKTDYVSSIQGEYVAQGAAAGMGPLTYPTVIPIQENGGGFGVAYALGSIYWSENTGAKTVRTGPVMDYYFARSGASGPMGWPASNLLPIAENGGGAAQAFSGGSLYKSNAGLFLVSSVIRDGYFEQAGAAGPLGWPIAEQVCGLTAGGCSQAFQNGTVFWSNASGSHPTWGAIASIYTSAGGSSSNWGYPTSPVLRYPGGSAQAFQNLSAYQADGLGAFIVYGSFRDYYFHLGGSAGTLGYPVGNQHCDLADGGCAQTFQYGSIIWSPTQGVRVGQYEIEQAYLAAGGQSGVLGNATTGNLSYSFNGGGIAQGFSGGAIYWKAGRGAFVVKSPITSGYFEQGGAAGYIGWPTSDISCNLVNSGCIQNFENGAVYWNSASGSHPIWGPLYTSYIESGGPSGPMGYPTSTVFGYPWQGGGSAQAFQGGSLYQRNGQPAYFVSGGFRDYYFSLGGAAGRLGFPTSTYQCNAGGTDCSQSFQGGTIKWSPTQGARIE